MLLCIEPDRTSFSCSSLVPGGLTLYHGTVPQIREASNQPSGLKASGLRLRLVAPLDFLRDFARYRRSDLAWFRGSGSVEHAE
jgi:hypothetical protein